MYARQTIEPMTSRAVATQTRTRTWMRTSRGCSRSTTAKKAQAATPRAVCSSGVARESSARMTAANAVNAATRTTVPRVVTAGSARAAALSRCGPS
ncbi:MAG: hypothetical protein A3H36_06915 [Chloroflexi bacterium RIFCSPLOWO2_02_FULL_71_16]|nr:MAG: hypothetical protein A3H36_06915 [Chloroflexi bacterium RIFCSPLOWO2_02_FULL_71_16]